MENVEPITNKEIEEIKKDVRYNVEIKNKIFVRLIIFSSIILALIMVSCTIFYMGKHTITLIVSIVVFNFIMFLILKKYYANKIR